jgi:Mg2+ and Co2+ transporter CorA
MTTDEVLELLGKLERRLTTVADQAEETCRQAQHTQERIERLRDDITRLRDSLLATADTVILRVSARDVRA